MTRFLMMVTHHRLVVFLLVGMVAVTGLFSYYLAPKQEQPDIAPPIALMTTVYPGALPEDVERLVTRKIEDEIESIAGYYRSNSRSVNGLSVVVLELEYGTDIEKAWVDLRNQLADLQQELPEEAHTIQVNTQLDETAGFIMAVTGKDHLSEDLYTVAEELKTSLGRVPGVSRIEISGEQTRHIQIQVTAEELNKVPLSLDQISRLIQAQTTSIPLGDVRPYPDESVRINMGRSVDEWQQLESLTLMTNPETGSTLRLGQIARIRPLIRENQPHILHEGKPSVLVTGYLTEGRNALFTGRDVSLLLDDFRQELPEGISLEKILFQPDDIRIKVNSFVVNLLQGMVFVIVMVMLGMGLRNALVVSSAIPLSVLMTFGFMRLTNIPVHQISIAALIISLGMLVDNAIVVSDAIQVRVDQGTPLMEAAVQGTRDVTRPVFSSTLTTIGAFIPLLLLDSLAGDFIRSVPQIVIMALIASYLVSVVFIPATASRVFRPWKKAGRTENMRRRFYALVDRGIQRPRISLLILAAFIITTIVMGTRLGLQFFPKADTDIAYVDVRMERDTGLHQTRNAALEVAVILDQYPEISRISLSVGDGFPKFYHSLPLPLPSRDYAQLLFRVDLHGASSFRNMTQLIDSLQRDFDEQLVGFQANAHLLEQADPIAAPVLVRISDGTAEDRQMAAAQTRKMLEEIPGTRNVRDDHAPALYEYQVKPEDERLLGLGLTRMQMARELSLGVMGETVGSIYLNGKDADLFLTSSIQTKSDLENLGLLIPNTMEKVPLKQMAEVAAAPQSPAILKHDGAETISVYSDILTGYNAVSIQNQLEQRLEAAPPQGVSLVYAGEKQEIIKYFGEVGVSGLLAAMIVFLILVIQFGRIRQPLLIMTTLPFSAAGSVAGLWLFRQPLSFTALLGMVSLFGIVVNNAIILLDYIQHQEREGMDPVEACRQAVALRLRPILLTTATTVMGLTPLILSGSDLFTPMAISLMSGLIMATFLTLVILPVLYLVTGEKKVNMEKQW